jgi:PAS domain S-box-containing protein
MSANEGSCVTEFVAAQSDLIQFLSLFAVVLCGLESFILHRGEGIERSWPAVFGFFLLQGLALLWTLALPFIDIPKVASVAVAPAVRALSFCCLFGMSSPSPSSRVLTIRPLLLSLIPLAASVSLGAFLGVAAFRAASVTLIAAPGVAIAVLFVMSDPQIHRQGRPRLVTFAVALIAFGIVTVLSAFSDLLAPGRAQQWATLIRSALFVMMAVSLSMHEWRDFNRLNQGYGRSLTRYVILAALFSLPVVLGLGSFFTVSLGDRAAAELLDRYTTNVTVIQETIAGNTGEVDRDVTLLSASSALPSLILRYDQGVKDSVVVLLNRFAREIQGTGFLLDRRGRVVASSSGATPAFSGGGHANAEWFQDAVTVGVGRSFDVGGAVLKPGYFSSAPVWDLSAGIVGVVLIEKDVSSFFPPTVPGTDAFLVDEAGVIIHATQESYVGRLLWPHRTVSGGAPGALADSALRYQAPLLSARVPSGSAVAWEGSKAMVARSFLPIAGWSVELLGSLDQVMQYRLAGLFVTLALALMIAVFAASGRLVLIDEVRIERSEGLYRALVEGSPNWVSVVDESGAFSFTNRAGKIRFGIAEEAVRNIPMESVIGKEHVEELAGLVREAAKNGNIDFETIMPTASGDARVWRGTMIPLLDEEKGAEGILIANDVTEARAAGARLMRAERLAALGTLAAGVAHQFNNIDSILLWNLQLLEALKDLPPTAKNYTDSMHTALRRSIDITARLLPLSETGGGDAHPRIGQVVRDVLTGIQPDLDREGIALVVRLEGDAPVVMGAVHLQFVVQALLVNAWHAVLDQPVRRISVSTSIAPGFEVLTVEDTGIGIADEKLSRIFTPFFSEKGEHADMGSPLARVRGVGLSLSVSYSVVSAAGGRIEVESRPGTATTFKVWLPIPSELT